MRPLTLITLLALLSCQKDTCYIETNADRFECDLHGYIDLTPIDRGVQISVSIATERISIYHNGKYHSAILTNGTICDGQSVSASSWTVGDIVTVGIDNGNFADELIIK